ncbi:MAG: hypothetical protein AAF391_00905 [Bacteroidota bacterium]
MPLNFDEVRVIEGEEKGACYTPLEFLHLSLSIRVKYIMGQQIAFYKNGTEMDKISCLNELRLSKAN